MDKPKVTPKDFFLWVGAMVALYVSVFSLVSLLFDYINYAYPDVLNTYIDPYSSSMRYEIASLIVLINSFPGGHLPARFGPQVLVVVLIAGGGFLHFLADLRGYWAIYPKRAQMVGWGTGVLILVSVVAGLFIIGSPGQMRLFRFDDQKVNDLTMLQYQIVNYWQQKERLPLALSDLEDPISGFAVPTDPQTEGSYRYEKTGALSFKLCADFNADSREDSRARVVAVPIGVDGMVGKGLETEAWQHGVGETCFERTIDPERYPPFKKQ